ncbi:MAG TPA: hypothetical protein PLI62_14225 [Spirochaetota bacterium]|nr:hypothetical protein [Spirochaetota bacterium]HQO03418.1 hypothetical protein [Spirochaetota bacterium]
MDLTIDDNFARELGIEKSEELRERASKILPVQITIPAVPGVIYHTLSIALEIEGVKMSLVIPFKKQQGKPQ